MNEKEVEYIEIKGLNICPASDWLEEFHKDKQWFLIVGKELKYQPENLKTPILIRRQEAFQLAIDIIRQNPLILFDWFILNYKHKGDSGHGREKIKEIETKKNQD